ncbi:SRPBCC family protein [Defluviimonas sp. SAOS-178_SWC]|uniref:SRPBCC family protein n=1 Tax=Defluviimonas sp. SAOS-178_SWC TaxID=3121287 RepID=UPI0032217AB3
MKFSTKEDVEAPAEIVFGAVSDFAAFERSALRRGADVARVDPAAEAGVGMTWSLRFPVRGKMRRVVCELDEYDPPSGLRCRIEGKGFNGMLTLGLVALSRSRTRLAVQLEVKPQTLAARLLLQSVRLNRASYTRRFEGRVQKFAADLELRHLTSRAP